MREPRFLSRYCLVLLSSCATSELHYMRDSLFTQPFYCIFKHVVQECADMSEPTELIAFLTPYPPEVADLLLEGRRLLLEKLSPVHEFHFDATAAVCAAFGYTENWRESFVNFAAYANHITLVFPWGVRLEDPDRRLKGDGSQVRNIRLTEGMKTLTDTYVLRLIEDASNMAPRGSEPLVPRVFIKVYNGPKRRPVLR
jgi:hypothetical protein